MSAVYCLLSNVITDNFIVIKINSKLQSKLMSIISISVTYVISSHKNNKRVASSIALQCNTFCAMEELFHISMVP